MHEKILNMKKNGSSYEIYSHDYRFDLTTEDLIGSGAFNEVYRLKGDGTQSELSKVGL